MADVTWHLPAWFCLHAPVTLSKIHILYKDFYNQEMTEMPVYPRREGTYRARVLSAVWVREPRDLPSKYGGSRCAKVSFLFISIHSWNIVILGNVLLWRNFLSMGQLTLLREV